ncbi:conserved hypothetical protein [Staphylococcus aureus subsp. aureus C160]|nr:conserved hypothetical protein [Staphylococcus aureus subsp. aureus C160]UYL83533.1 hypothetical protein [Staphylococcus phage Sa2wa-st573]
MARRCHMGACNNCYDCSHYCINYCVITLREVDIMSWARWLSCYLYGRKCK